MDRLTPWVMILVFLEVGLVALWIAVGSGRQRRSHFWVRVLLATLALPAWMAVLAGDTRLHVVSLSDDAAKAVLPLLFFLGAIACSLCLACCTSTRINHPVLLSQMVEADPVPGGLAPRLMTLAEAFRCPMPTKPPQEHVTTARRFSMG